MTTKTLIDRLAEIRTGHMDGNNSEQYFPADRAIAIIREHNAEQNHGAVACDIDKTQEEAERPAKELGVKVSPAPAHSAPHELVELVARAIAGDNPDETDGGYPPKAHWEYCVETARAAIAAIPASSWRDE
ncbi:MAG TPA: hypothetical protein VHW09_27295 [Bryobacteraceae bacterium]|jgi:hypothetical protein|nr:hypothetical protein [Bryobacteraceae bacterium]